MHTDNPLNPWNTLSRNQVYESPWITLEHHEVMNPGGKSGTYSVVRFKRLAIGVLPLDDQYNTWIVGQYRYPLDVYSWEIPEGGGDRDVPPLESAKRELLEECGIIAASWQQILYMHTSNSGTDEEAYLFVAKNLSFTQSQPDDDEQLEVRKVPFEELYQDVCNGNITDALTIATVLRAKLLMQEGLL